MKTALSASWRQAPMFTAPDILLRFAAGFPNLTWAYHCAELAAPASMKSYAHILQSDSGGLAVSWSGSGQRAGVVVTSIKKLEAVKRMVERGDISSVAPFKPLRSRLPKRRQRRVGAPSIKALAAPALRLPAPEL